MDGTVRDSVGNLMSLRYGGDGYNAKYVETVKLPVLLMSDMDIQQKYRFDNETLHRVLEMRTQLQRVKLNGMRTIDAKFRLPLNITRMMQIEDADFSMFAPDDMFASWSDVVNFETTLKDDLPMRLHLLCACATVVKRGKMIPSSIFDLIRYRMERAKIESGEAVGPIASTSIGEPTTQVSNLCNCFFVETTTFN